MGIVSMFAWFGHANGGYQGGVLYDFSGNYTFNIPTRFYY